MRLLGLTLISAGVLAAVSATAAIAAPSTQLQLSCSTYSKVRSRNETYVMNLDLGRKSGAVVRDSEPSANVPVISNDKTIAVIMKADGGQYIYYIARDSAKLTASFTKGGPGVPDQVYGACTTPSGGAL